MSPDARAAHRSGLPKFCPYCMAAHSERGRACCLEHARRIASRLSAERQGRERAAQLALSAADKRCRSRRRWRDIAFGRNTDARLREIFGIDVTTDDPGRLGHRGKAADVNGLTAPGSGDDA